MSALSATSIRAASSSANLSALQRSDPSIQQLLVTAKHTVLYKLDQAQAWVKQDVEGPMFVVQRSAAPHYRLLILNRRGADNYSVALSSDMKLERTEQYLFYTAQEADGLGVYNLWFYEEEDCIAALQVMTNLVEGLNDSPPAAAANHHQTPAAAQPAASQQQSQQQSGSAPAQPQASAAATKQRAALAASVPRNVDYSQAIDEGGGQRALHQQLSSFLTKFQQTDDAHVAAEKQRRQHEQQQQQRLQATEPAQPRQQQEQAAAPTQLASNSQQQPTNQATTAGLHGLLEQMNIRTNQLGRDHPAASYGHDSHQQQQQHHHNTNGQQHFAQPHQYQPQPAQPTQAPAPATNSKQLNQEQFRVVLSKLVQDEKWLNYMYKKYQQHNYDLKAMFK